MPATIRDVMTGEFLTIPLNTPLADAEQLLIDRQLTELFVVDEEGRVVGVLPDYALLKLRFSDDEGPNHLDGLMSRRFLVISPESPLSVGARYLRDHWHHRLAVVEHRRLVGVLTRQRVLAYLHAQTQSEEVAA